MKQLLFVVIVIFAVSVTLSSALAPLLAPRESSAVIDGEYIVVFNKETSADEVAEHKSAVFPMLSNGSMILHEYEIGTEFRGYAAKMGRDEVQKVRTMPNVRYVEKNKIVEINDGVSCKMQSSATWGLVRTTRRAWPPHHYSYSYGSDGQGVDVYVIDSGIEVGHPDFEDRATWGADFTEGAYNYVDENGHGTHVAGTIMGRKYGVAKKATAVAVKVFGASGRGAVSTVIRGITHVVNHFNPSKSTVVNMSLGGGISRSQDQAVRAAISRGIHFAVAAGNEGQNACYKSPARVPEAVTVAASDAQDKLASFSNYGQCVDIIGPGVDITSNWIGNRVKTISGTSMATPHVAGVMAKVLSKKPYYTPAQLKHYLLQNATQDQVSGLNGSKWQTPNKLLYLSC